VKIAINSQFSNITQSELLLNTLFESMATVSLL
jgi:hypothetical protein